MRGTVLEGAWCESFTFVVTLIFEIMRGLIRGWKYIVSFNCLKYQIYRAANEADWRTESQMSDRDLPRRTRHLEQALSASDDGMTRVGFLRLTESCLALRAFLFPALTSGF